MRSQSECTRPGEQAGCPPWQGRTLGVSSRTLAAEVGFRPNCRFARLGRSQNEETAIDPTSWPVAIAPEYAAFCGSFRLATVRLDVELLEPGLLLALSQNRIGVEDQNEHRLLTSVAGALDRGRALKARGWS